MSISNNRLIVYKASAGSGKTFTLAIEYISLLINNPKSYENILAVTFTNKATEEMKMRILSQLYGISKKLPDSNNYLKMVMKKTGKSENEVIKNASIALSYLIHNYNYFRVQTIDAFFQSILRNLARELDLTANLRIDLNDRQVEEYAVEELIESLEQGDKVLDWIREYIDSNISEERNWNIIGEIKKFGMNIFKDFYKEHRKELDDLMKNDKFFNDYRKSLNTRMKIISDDIINKAKEIISILESHDLNDFSYFPYGNRGSILSYIRKLAEGIFDGGATPKRVEDCQNDASKWAKKKTDKTNDLIELAESCLNEKLFIVENTRKTNWKDYKSAELTLLNLDKLRLLHAINEAIEVINKDANRFQLSNTQTLLNSLICDSDTPFIYEKIGAQLKHIMIDEFQDTSTIQWRNFKVLLQNCIGQRDSHNLIVGDVKQSIYRWRSGDWRLLNNIGNEFRREDMAIMPLDTNYRSEQNIVDFNNAFFEEAVKKTVNELEADNIDGFNQLAKAYDAISLKQLANKQDGKGYIRIELLPKADYKENIMQKLLDTIDEMLARGIKEKDIAIIVRVNKDIEYIANLLMTERPNIKLVSDEAFKLDASIAVKMIIYAMKLIIHPEDVLTKMNLAKAYSYNILHNTSHDIVFTAQNIEEVLPKEFVNSFAELSAMPVFDIADRIYNIFNLSLLKDQSAYICAFYDYMNEFLSNNISGIEDFIEEWDSKLYEKTIQSDEVDGIRIISIHKSKGLEFDNVIIPLCDWQLEQRSTIWCEKSDVDPYDKLPIVPIEYSKNNMMGTVYEKDYKAEHLQNTVDNMNLLYVAFTRAGKNLVITGKRMSANKFNSKDAATSVNRSEILESCLPNIAMRLDDSTLTGIDNTDEEICFEYGQLCVPRDEFNKEKQQTSNVFTSYIEPHRIDIESYDTPIEFRQSNKSKDFVSGEGESPTLSYIKIGNVLHKLFSTIRTTADIESRLRELELNGIIYDDDISVEKLRSKLDTALSDKTVKEWFSDEWTLYNECTILTKDSAGKLIEYRPDRVMVSNKETVIVDFKFGVPRPEYKEQVSNYMKLLSQMGYKGVRGYIWYVLRNNIVEVD